MRAFLSLGERLVLKPSFDQVKASQSFRKEEFQAGPLWLPPFRCSHHTPNQTPVH